MCVIVCIIQNWNSSIEQVSKQTKKKKGTIFFCRRKKNKTNAVHRPPSTEWNLAFCHHTQFSTTLEFSPLFRLLCHFYRNLSSQTKYGIVLLLYSFAVCFRIYLSKKEKKKEKSAPPDFVSRNQRRTNKTKKKKNPGTFFSSLFHPPRHSVETLNTRIFANRSFIASWILLVRHFAVVNYPRLNGHF